MGCAQSLQSCLILCDLWTVDDKAPLSMGCSKQEYWSGLLCPPPGELPNPGIKPIISGISCIAGIFFTNEPNEMNQLMENKFVKL